MINEVRKKQTPLTNNELWGTTESPQIARLMAERDLLLFAIAPKDYAKIEVALSAISKTTDDGPLEIPLTDSMSSAVRNALWRFNAALTIRRLREAQKAAIDSRIDELRVFMSVTKITNPLIAIDEFQRRYPNGVPGGMHEGDATVFLEDEGQL